MPSTTIEKYELERGVNVIDLFMMVNLVSSKSEARRLIQQGGCYINDKRVETIELRIDLSFSDGNGIILRAGKKRYHRIVIA